MEYGNSGSFTLTGTQNFSVVIDWTEVYEDSNNYHIGLFLRLPCIDYIINPRQVLGTVTATKAVLGREHSTCHQSFLEGDSSKKRGQCD